MEEDEGEEEKKRGCLRRRCGRLCCCAVVLGLSVLAALTARYLFRLFSQPDDPSVKMITVCVRWMPKLCVTGRLDMIPDLAFKYKFIHD